MTMHHFFETRKRSILKTISWKIIATGITFNVVYFQTGDLDASLKTSGIVLAIGIVAYYLHERGWNSVHWEKQHTENF